MERVGLVVLVLGVVVGLVGCGASRPARVNTEVLELRLSALGSAYAKLQGSIPVRLAGKLMTQDFRGPGSRVSRASAVHGRKRCSVQSVLGNEASGGLSNYAGERVTMTLYGNAEISHAICSAWKPG